MTNMNITGFEVGLMISGLIGNSRIGWHSNISVRYLDAGKTEKSKLSEFQFEPRPMKFQFGRDVVYLAPVDELIKPNPHSSTQFDPYWRKTVVAHRLDGPAVIRRNCVYEQWYINGEDISDEVHNWLADNPSIPNWRKWTKVDKTMFALRFR